jgi:prepilin signal peptidase PulO-like enzyme (type II secretory pathway)
VGVAEFSYGWAVILWFGVLGLCVGSFVNVFCYRWPIIKGAGEFADGKRLQELVAIHGKFTLASPRSACPCCQSKVRAHHNLPVIGWVWLRGKCKDCGSSISWKYPAVELLFGLVFAGYVWFEGVWLAGLLSLILMPVAFSFLWLRIAHRHNDKVLIWSYIFTLTAQIGLSGLGLSAYAQ